MTSWIVKKTNKKNSELDLLKKARIVAVWVVEWVSYKNRTR